MGRHGGVIPEAPGLEPQGVVTNSSRYPPGKCSMLCMFALSVYVFEHFPGLSLLRLFCCHEPPPASNAGACSGTMSLVASPEDDQSQPGGSSEPLDPVHPGRARRLLKEGKAAVYRRYPFTLILEGQVDEDAPSDLRIKLDLGAKTSGLALVHDATGEVVWAAELSHRGANIKKRMDGRRGVRRKRRSRKPRFENRASSRRKGRLPTSLQSRVANVLTWVGRLRRLCPIEAISKEVPLEIEHILCRARGGMHRLSNLTLACNPCNVKKGTQFIEDFLNKQPEVLAHILARAKASLTDAAAVNAMRWALYEGLEATGLALETGSGDLVRAVVPQGARAGTHVGRVLARESFSFDLLIKAGRQAGISYRYCRPIHRNDGYSYQQGARHAAPPPHPLNREGPFFPRINDGERMVQICDDECRLLHMCACSNTLLSRIPASCLHLSLLHCT